MGLQLKEALGNLCRSGGWSYVILWRAKSPDSMLLMPEDAYYEEHTRMLAEKMLNQVHLVGEGIIGQVAFTGKHRWIFSDTYCGESSPTGLLNNQAVSQDTAEWHRQFLAGIKTIALISVSHQSVVQLGSTQKIHERLEFLDQTRNLFQQMQSVLGPILYGSSQKVLNSETYNPFLTFASVLPSNILASSVGNTSFLDDKGCNKHIAKDQYSTILTKPSNPASMELYNGSLSPHIMTVPVTASSTCTTKDSSDSCQKMTTFMSNASFPLMNQCQTIGADAQVLLSKPRIQMPEISQPSNSGSAGSSSLKIPSMSTCSSDASCLTSVEQGLLSRMKIQRSSTFPTTSDTHYPCGKTFLNFQGNSSLTPLWNTNRTFDTIMTTRYEAGKLADIQHTSPLFHVAEGSPFLLQPPRESSTVHTLLGASGPTDPMYGHSNSSPVNNLNEWNSPPPEQMNNENLLRGLGIDPLASGFTGADAFSGIPVSEMPLSVQNSTDCDPSLQEVSDSKKNSSNMAVQLSADHDLFDSLGLDPRHKGQESWNDMIFPVGSNHSNLSTAISDCISELDAGSMTGPEKGFFPEVGLDQLLEAVVGNVNLVANHNSDDHLSTTTITRTSSTSVYSNQVPSVGLSCFSGSMDALLSECNSQKSSHGSHKEALTKSLVSSWIDGSYNMNSGSIAASQPKRSEEQVKLTKKRARPGESTRPRPKDRQQIQDRVKELRDIVPNGAKCSIDALLDRTIKHMLFLQSVTKYADKLKQIDEPKMIGKESGVVLKDNSSGGGGDGGGIGGATWAFEVGGRTMVCPIIVEDLNPLGQMLVEMLCEEQGFFLEIAEIIRGFGLTILKGVMEVRDDKIWARFVVEANRDVTRMDIFLSLVQLLQQTTNGVGSGRQPNKVVDNSASAFPNHQQSPTPLPISLADRLQ